MAQELLKAHTVLQGRLGIKGMPLAPLANGAVTLKLKVPETHIRLLRSVGADGGGYQLLWNSLTGEYVTMNKDKESL